MKKGNEISSYLENFSLLIWGIFFLSLPLIFATFTTEIFILPKQILLGVVLLITILFFGIKMISDGTVRLRRTPFDLPVFLFALFVFLSSILSLNRFESLIAFVPLLLAIIAYFTIVNFVKTKESLMFMIYSLIAGAVIVSVLGILSFFKVYLLPFDFAKSQTFSPLGSSLDQAIYLFLCAVVAGYFILPLVKSGGQIFKKAGEVTPNTLFFIVSFLIVTAGVIVSLYESFALQKPLLLPLETGFQTAFASISQDAGRTVFGFLLGSGFGTFMTVFTRFKQIAFNANPTLWSLTFLRSSNFILELLATTGVLGVASFIFLIVKVLKFDGYKKLFKENPLFAPLALIFILSFLLPISFIIQLILFAFLGLFAAEEALKSPHKFPDFELNVVAFKKTSVFEDQPIAREAAVVGTKIMPILFFVIFLAFLGTIAFYSFRFVASDMLFRKSFASSAGNNSLESYNNQTKAIETFPYRDVYYRIYSQTNLALADSVAASQPKGSSVSAQTQQTIYSLIQKSIDSARQAKELSPLSVLNSRNQAAIYRSLIGFGKNAEDYAVLTSQQAISLDPNNPQEYLDLGGIYYQLGLWDNAQNQFQLAINLKPDFANAYYNLGHALEQKQDYQNALNAYQAVKTLVANDQPNVKKISSEIDILQKKIGAIEQAKGTKAPTALTTDQPPLGINNPPAKLPEQKPPVQIPPPSDASQGAK